MSVNPTTNRIYVANYWSHNVSVIDGVNNQVIATVSVGSAPYGVSVNPITNRIDENNFIGVGLLSEDGFDIQDAEKSPNSPSPYLHLYFKQDGENLSEDIKSKMTITGEKKTWDMVLETDVVQRGIQINWSEVLPLPDDTRLTLTDLSGGKSINMRRTNSCVFNSGSGGKRYFRIIAEKTDRPQQGCFPCLVFTFSFFLF